LARILLSAPDIILLDEPTNHLDLESIEALVQGLKAYDGTLILVSHDRWFVGQLATRILEIEPEGVTDYPGTYDEYVQTAGDDHLDADMVVRKSREKRKDRKKAPPERENGRREARPKRSDPEQRRQALERRAGELIEAVEAAATRVAEIDARFVEPGFFERTPPDEVAALDRERKELEAEAARLTQEWERVESEASNGR